MSHRILYVIESLFPLGVAQQVSGLALALAEQGHEIHVAVLGEKTPIPQHWTDAGIEVQFLNGDDRTPLHAFRDGLHIVRELRSQIRSLAPAIVHSWCGLSEAFTLLASRDIPVARRMNRFRLISTQLSFLPRKRLAQRMVERFHSRRIESRIVPHPSLRTSLTENGFPQSRTSVIPNGVVLGRPNTDRSICRRDLFRRLDLPESSYLAGTVASLVHQTRLKDLIWATDLLTCIRPDFHFVIIGKGSQLRRLKRFAALTEAKSHIHFLGHPDSPESCVASLDFYWNSHLRDPLSGNLMAAMARGIPSISVWGLGTEELVRHQETGFAVNFGARDEFARWTKFLIEKPDQAAKLARQGQAFVRSKFELADMVNSYSAIYDRDPDFSELGFNEPGLI